MKAVILCAGYGTRMQPLTYYVNKAMVPLAGKPVLQHIVEKLRDAGITDFVVALSHLAEQVLNAFGDGERLGVHLDFVVSDKPHGTAGEIAHMRVHLDGEDSFLVHYGDILTDIDVPGMMAAHGSDERIATIGLVTGVTIHTGIAKLDGDRMVAFTEKPALDEPCHASVSIFSGGALDYMKEGQDIATHTIPAMIAAGERVCGFLDPEASWRDVGRLSDLSELAGEA